MVEPVGATIGALSLAGLVTVCLDCFDFMRTANSVGKDFVLLEGQLSCLRIRLFAWRKACGFMDLNGHDRRIDNPGWQNHIQAQLNGLCSLFLDLTKLVERYDINERYQQQWGNPDGPNSQFVQEGVRDFLRRMKATKKHAGLSGALLWGLKDKKDFTELLARARECMDALELVTQNLDLFETQRCVVSHEVSTISDTVVLEGMAAVGPDGDIASDAASQRLVEVRTLSSGSGADTFYTAFSHLEIEPPEELPGSGFEGLVGQHERIMKELLASRTTEQRIPVTFGEGDRSWGQHIAALRKADQDRLLQNPIFRDRSGLKRASHAVGARPGKRRLMLMMSDLVRGTDECSVALVDDRYDIIRLSFEGPTGTPYEGGLFHLLLKFDEERFPFRAPDARMITRIYHPNIAPSGNICNELLGQGWTAAYGTFLSIAMTICGMLTSPTLEDPLVPEIAELCVRDPEQYVDNAKLYTKRYATADQDISDATLMQRLPDQRVLDEAANRRSQFQPDTLPYTEVSARRRGNIATAS